MLCPCHKAFGARERVRVRRKQTAAAAARRSIRAIPMGEEKLVAVYRAGNAIEGNFLQGLLAKKGIPVKLLAEGGTKGSREVEIQVPADKVDAARRVLKE